MIAIVLFAVTATFRPPAPTVGDLITIDFPQAVTLDRSPQYEIVIQHGKRVVIRTFEPKPFAISGRVGGIAFRNLIVPVRSVLKPRDNLAPAPLKPPKREPYPMPPFVLMAVAALLAIAAWSAVVWLAKRQKLPKPVVAPAERFRHAVGRARTWAELADAVREYIDATTLTTTEVLEKNSSATVEEILRQGDLEKFSPWGAKPGDLRTLKQQALELAA
ncbi:MAG TPA: hypothetical protein VL284_08780 [Thermoanaerobaculia bacterium]|nr:hypothetical protein [Thermoanaerobaculia bacterium]